VSHISVHVGLGILSVNVYLTISFLPSVLSSCYGVVSKRLNMLEILSSFRIAISLVFSGNGVPKFWHGKTLNRRRKRRKIIHCTIVRNQGTYMRSIESVIRDDFEGHCYCCKLLEDQQFEKYSNIIIPTDVHRGEKLCLFYEVH